MGDLVIRGHKVGQISSSHVYVHQMPYDLNLDLDLDFLITGA